MCSATGRLIRRLPGRGRGCARGLYLRAALLVAVRARADLELTQGVVGHLVALPFR